MDAWAWTLARVRALSAAHVEPTITDDELEGILRHHAMPDRYGASPSDAGWVPTYDVDAALADAWRLKAAKAVGEQAVSADGLTAEGGKRAERFLAIAAEYDRRAIAGVSRCVTGTKDQVANL